MEKIREIASKFNFDGTFKRFEENNQGNINKTYILVYEKDGKEIKYLLQKVNSTVFTEPYLVMRNIELVTNHINRKLTEMNDTTHATLSMIKTEDGENTVTFINEDGEKEYYRAFDFIENCVSYNSLNEAQEMHQNPTMIAYHAGKNLGNFQKMLSDFPTTMLAETIKDFHNTKKRFYDLLLSIENKVTKRAYKHSKEIVDLISMIKECSIIIDSLGKTIPMRVTHNDTKLNNNLMDRETGQGIALIDLDTVMPGSALFDIGDGVRSVCSNCFEDETNKDLIFLNLDYTKSYLKGYLEEMADYLTPEEINNIAASIKTLTYELTVRFLTDYINGDTYFKIQYKEHNRDRFMNQYLLLKDIIKKEDEINEYVVKTARTLRK